MSNKMESPIEPARRSFLGKLTGLISASVVAFLGIVVGRFALYPAFRKEREDLGWVVVGPLDEIPMPEPVKQSVVISQDSGWARFNTQRLILVVRSNSGLLVFSATCPHLGCTVNAAPNGFICPCHGSAWDSKGNRLGGPTPRGLDTLDYRIQDGVLQIKYQFFKQGIAAKEVIS